MKVGFKGLAGVDMIDYYTLATEFRRKIEYACESHRFSARDRMSRFPMGCCDDSTDLFANYLWQTCGIRSYRVDGVYFADNSEDSIWHTWLEVENVIIDLTADQFPDYESMYVGKADSFHQKFEVHSREFYRGFLDLSENCWSRMQDCYDAIIAQD